MNFFSLAENNSLVVSIAGATALLGLVVLLHGWLSPKVQIVVQADGSKTRYLYPVAASGWLPILGHALQLISDDAPGWIWKNKKIRGRHPFYMELLGSRIVQSAGSEFRRAISRAGDDQLCSKQGNEALFNFELTFGSGDMLDRPFQIKVIHTTFVPLRKLLVSQVERGLMKAMAQQFSSLQTAGDSAVVSPLHTVIFDMIGTMLSVILAGEVLGKDPVLVPAFKELTSVINFVTFQSSAKPKFLVDRRRLVELTAVIHQHIEPEVRARRQQADNANTTKQHMDFLQLLIEARDKDGQEYPPDVITNRMLGIIFATFDTTSTTLSNLILELASPSKTCIKRRVQSEVDSIPSNLPLTQENVSQRMTYTKVCQYESLRRQKDIVGAPLRKVVNQDFRVPLGKGVDGIPEVAVIPKGYILSFNNLLVNHDPDNFEAPESFDPERNQLQNSHGTTPAGIAKHTLGFGLGRHQCPGRFFAAEEIQTAIVVLFRHLDFTAEEDYQPTVKAGVACNEAPLPIRVTLKESGEKLFREIRTGQIAGNEVGETK